jgi:hypothetical protein
VGTLREVDRVRRRVRPRAREHRAAVAHGVDGRLDELQALVVRERRRLAGRARDDDAVRAVVEQVAREGAERLDVDGAVGAERRHDRCQDLAEHPRDCTPHLPG